MLGYIPNVLCVACVALVWFIAQAVDWKVTPPECGTIDSTGNLTAPATVAKPVNCTVTATSQEDPTKSDSAVVTLEASPPPIVVTVSPKTATVKPGKSAKFSATVTGGSAPVPPPTGSVVFEYLAGFPKGCTAAIGAVTPAGALTVCRNSHENPLGTFALPAIGGTWIDENFGYPVRVLTRGNVAHAYSTPSALSANSKYAYVFEGLGSSGASIVDVASAVMSPPLPLNIGVGAPPHPHPTDDDLFYVFVGAKLLRYRVSTKVADTIFDVAAAFSGAMPKVGGMGNVTADGLLGFWVPDRKQVCVINVFTGKLYSADYGAFGTAEDDSVLPAHGVDPNGKRYVRMGTHPVDLFFTVNEAAHRLEFAFNAPAGSGIHARHGDMAHDAGGRQYLFTERDDPGDTTGGSGRDYVLYPLASEGNLERDRIVVARVHVGGDVDVWPAPHFGCSVNVPVCAVSIPQEPKRPDTDLTTPLARGNYTGEIWSAYLGAPTSSTLSIRVKRLFQHGSITNGDYWRTPRVSPSPDGKQLVVTTNGWDPRRQVFVAMAPTGF